MNLLIGDHYTIVQELRRGAWVTVYEARHTILGRKTLIKWLNPSYKDDTELVGRLRREARLGAAVDHPNVARIYEVGDADGRPYVAIEWIPGDDLGEVLEEQGVFEPERALRLARDLFSGLAAIHAVGIVHRDMSPMNVRITPEGVARITDFGLATGPFDTHYTLPGSVVGTPGYLSPEQASGKGADVRSDLFSCGVLLHEAVGGRALFKDDDLITTLKQVRARSAPPLEGEVEGLPPGFDAWLGKLLAKSPDERFQDAGEALAGLAALTGEEIEVPRAVRTANRPRWGVLGVAFVLLVVVAVTLPGYLGKRSGAHLEGISDSTAFALPDSGIGGRDAAPSMPVEDTTAFREEQETPNPPVSPPSSTPEERERNDRAVRTASTPGGSRSLDSLARGGDESGGERESETPPEPGDGELLTPLPMEGWLLVHTQPWAEVYVDAQRMGATPGLRAIKRKEGAVRLTLDNPGFPPIPVDTRVIAAETTEVTIQLADHVASLFVTATPWAKVYLDDVPVGDTPITRAIYLSPGPHQLRFTHPEFGEVEKEVDAAAGEKLNLTIDMRQEGTRFAPSSTEEPR